MNKWVYRGFSGVLYGASLILFTLFYKDILHMLSHIFWLQYSVKIFSPILCIYLGIFYSFCGIRTDKINTLSDLSIYMLTASFVVSLALMYFSIHLQILSTVGGILMPSGLVFSVIISIVSLFYIE